MNEILITGIRVEELLEKIESIIDSKLSKSQTDTSSKYSDYLTRSEVAKILKISSPTLRDWTKIGWLRSYKIGARVFYKKSELDESIAKCTLSKNKKGVNYA